MKRSDIEKAGQLLTDLKVTTWALDFVARNGCDRVEIFSKSNSVAYSRMSAAIIRPALEAQRVEQEEALRALGVEIKP